MQKGGRTEPQPAPSAPQPHGDVLRVTQGDSWDIGRTFGPGQPVLLGPVGSRVDGVPAVRLHCRLNQLLALSWTRRILHRGHR